MPSCNSNQRSANDPRYISGEYTHVDNANMVKSSSGWNEAKTDWHHLQLTTAEPVEKDDTTWGNDQRVTSHFLGVFLLNFFVHVNFSSLPGRFNQ